jgi:hypothetical protein
MKSGDLRVKNWGKVGWITGEVISWYSRRGGDGRCISVVLCASFGKPGVGG